MGITNKGFINFNEKYNKKTDKFMEASMTIYNGKDESGEAKYNHIKIKVFKDLIPTLEANVGKLCEVSGNLRLNEYNGNKYPEILVSEFIDGNAPQQENKQMQNFNNSKPIEIDENDLPF